MVGLGVYSARAEATYEHIETDCHQSNRTVMEGWDDAEIAAKSAIRWKILISGERGPSAGLVNA